MKCHPDIPIPDIQVGDCVRATVICSSKPPSWSNRTHRTVERNGTIKELCGNIVRIEWSGKIYNVFRADIHKAWGNR